MPYNPGIQDISGQLLAQGMQARAQGIAGGVTTLFQGLQQNQMMTNQAIARFQAASAANPKLLDFLNKAGTEESPVPVNPDVLKAYSDIKSGKTNVQNTALLAQFADSYNQAEMAQQMQMLRQSQMAQIAQENKLRAAQEGETVAQTRTRQLQNLAAEEDLRRSYGLTLPGAGGPAGQPAGPTVTQMAGPAPAPARPRSIYEMPGQLPMSKEEADYVAQQAAAAPAPATGAEAAAKFAPPRAGAAGFQTPPGLDPELYAAAKAEGLRSIASGRGPSDVMATYNRLLAAKKTERQEALKAQEQMTFNQASARAEELNKQYPDRFYAPKPNPDGATYSLDVTLRPPSTEKQADVARLSALGQERAKTAGQRLNDIRDAGTASRDNISRYDRMELALQNGVRTGFGAEALKEITSAGVAVGLYPEKQQAEKEVLLKLLRVDALQNAKLYYKGQGSISAPERAYIEKLSISAETNPAALLELIRINRALALRANAADEQRAALERQYRKDPEREITVADAMDDWFQANPLKNYTAAARMPVTARETADDIYNTVMGGKR
jgi:hypothetical protein